MNKWMVGRPTVAITVLLASSWVTGFAMGTESKRALRGTSVATPLSGADLKALGGKLQGLGPARTAAKRSAAQRSLLSTAAAAHTARPGTVLAQARAGKFSAPALEVHWNHGTGTPAFLSVKGLRRPAPLAKVSAEAASLGYLEANRRLFRLEDPAHDLERMEERVDGLGKRHVRFRQRYRGVPIWGHEIAVHLDADGAPYAVNAHSIPTPAGLGLPAFRLTAQEAIAAATRDIAARSPIRPLSPDAQDLLGYAGPSATRQVWIDPKTNAPRWVWHVALRSGFRDHWTCFVDAATGAVLERYNATAFDGPAKAEAVDLMGTTRSLNTWQAAGGYFLIDATRKTFDAKSAMPRNPKGALWTMDARGTDLEQVFQVASGNNAWTDPVAVSAHYNLGQVFEYYLARFGRLGIDGKGSNMISVVHVTYLGMPMDNAYWNGKAMAYGDGDFLFRPLARALDVAAHEMTHGVIQHTANLEYKFQSGALNESLADVFGAMVDRDDWRLGEDVVNPALYPSGAMRDMKDPHNGRRGPWELGWQPAHMDEFQELSLEDDNGGVHINSGIPNRACVLIAEAIGREKTEDIYYRVLDAGYLTSTSRFIDMRLAAVRAAADLHGEASPEVAAVKAGFDQVGIKDGSGTRRPDDLLPVQGEELLAVVNAEGGDQSLYLAKPVVASDEDFVQASTTQVFTGSGNPVAIPDDGSAILFIDADNNLRGLDEEGEQMVSATGNWRSIAVSPDGTKVAATTLEADTTIYILDLVNPGASKAIRLYTPTTGDGVRAKNVVYADALDWNSTGEFLLYDAFNRVPQKDGKDIEYWDVNLLEVSSETITPFYASLPDGISIGNPSFAQTSDLNFVFDLYDEASRTYAVLAADFFTGGLAVIDSNLVAPGYPRYSVNDSRMVYERKATGKTDLLQVALKPDRIAPASRAGLYLTGAQKPTWFATGRRPVGLPRAGKPLASQVDFNVESSRGDGAHDFRIRLPAEATVAVSVFDIQGRRLTRMDLGRMGAGEHIARGQAVKARGLRFYRMEVRFPDGRTSVVTRNATLAH